MINFLQQGGQTTKKQSSNNLEKGVMLFVQALALTLLADPQLIILAALANPEALKSAALVYLLTQDIQQAAQTFAQAMLSQTQAARHGAKLSYLKNLKHQCPEDEELYYFKKGGKAGCGCRKKEDGGKVEDKKESIISKFKKACGGSKIKLKKHKLGGSLKSIPFYQGGTTKNGIITRITPAGSLSTPGIVDFSKFSNSIPKVPDLPQAPVLSEPKLKFTLYNPEATFNAEEAYNSALSKAILDNGGHMGRRAIKRFRQQWDTTGRWDAQNDWEAKQHQAYMNELDMRQQYIKNRNAELLKAMMDKISAPVQPAQVETPTLPTQVKTPVESSKSTIPQSNKTDSNLPQLNNKPITIEDLINKGNLLRNAWYEADTDLFDWNSLSNPSLNKVRQALLKMGVTLVPEITKDKFGSKSDSYKAFHEYLRSLLGNEYSRVLSYMDKGKYKYGGKFKKLLKK